jgi:protein transport protein SEC20
MQSELSRSKFAQETLEQSTLALSDLGEKYSGLNSLLASSKTLVTTLLKSQKSDTWYLETTLYILLTTLIWLFFRRILYGPLSWFVLWPLKIVFRIFFAVAPIGASTSSSSSLSAANEPSTSLIVQPSAKGDIPKRPNLNNQEANYVRVGGGGRGHAQQEEDPSAPDSLSQQVGQMAEQAQQQEQQSQQGSQAQAQQNEPVQRADGTVLEESDRPKNPKKRMFEANVEDAKVEAGSQGEKVGAEEGGEQWKRDEL